MIDITPNYFAPNETSGQGLFACLSKGFFDKNIKSEFSLLLAISLFAEKLGYCTATNKYFSQMLNVSEVTISRKINKLKACGYITIEYNKRGCEIKSREIRLVPMLIVDYQKCQSRDIHVKEKEDKKNIENQQVTPDERQSHDYHKIENAINHDYQNNQSRKTNMSQSSFNFINEKQADSERQTDTKKPSTINMIKITKKREEKESIKEKEDKKNIIYITREREEKRKVKQLVPLDWYPKPETIEKLRKRGIDTDRVVEKFINSCHANNYRYINFDMAILAWNWERDKELLKPVETIVPPIAKQKEDDSLARRAEEAMRRNMEACLARFSQSKKV